MFWINICNICNIIIIHTHSKSILVNIKYYFWTCLVNIKSILSFKSSNTQTVVDFEEIPRLVEIMVKDYSKSFTGHNFSFRILLPRSKDSQKINNHTKKMGLQIQNDFLLGIRKLKLKPNIREFKYVHDEEHFGWLLIDQSIYDMLNAD